LHDPEQLAAGYNLAIVECSLGNTESAIQTLNRILFFSPDAAHARRLEIAIRDGSARCGQR